MAQKLREMCVLQETSRMWPVRLANQAVQYHCAPTSPSGTACSAPSGADSSLVGGPQNKHVKRKATTLPHITCLRWPVLRSVWSWPLRRLRSMPDACRRLRTLVTVQHGVSVMMPVIIESAYCPVLRCTEPTENAQITGNSRDVVFFMSMLFVGSPAPLTTLRRKKSSMP